MTAMLSLRARNRLNAMRLTQRTALPKFYEHGFDAVTVGEIAADVGVAASTIYRHFETKEGIVLWDEHDPEIDAAIGRRLRRRGNQSPLDAIRDALIESLATRYDAETEFQLPRIRYIFATEQLHGAAVEGDFRARHDLATALEQMLPKKEQRRARITAGAALLALDIALEDWQASSAAHPLASYIKTSFADLRALG